MMTPVLLTILSAAPTLTSDDQQQILAQTETIKLAPDLSSLTDGEKKAVEKLLQVGMIFQDVYEHSRHPAALDVRKKLAGKSTPQSRLYDLFAGPIATTLENERRPFVKVAPEAPGRNVYPWQITRDEVDAYLAKHPASRDELLHPLTVVRRASPAQVKTDLAALRRHPVLAGLHPDLERRLRGVLRAGDPKALYAVPYAVAYADQMVKAHRLLWDAAAAISSDDPEFAGYLRNRARDLLTNDYESGDAAWVTGRFKTLNAQIGAYETYDDELYAQKAFYSLSIVKRDEAASGPLARAVSALQKLEDSLPYTPHKPVRSDIPIGAYDVIADFGQARSANTATILPNDERHARRYGRTILLRANVLRHPDLFERGRATWTAAVAPVHHDDIAAEGKLNRTFWHEVGHYLGPEVDARGTAVQVALGPVHNHLEEMKADLVSLFLAQSLRKTGFYDDQRLRNVYADGILRVLQPVKPRREQAYGTMQLMQLNWFLEHGLLTRKKDGLHIDYARYHDVVAKLLAKVLEVQRSGDAAAANAFVDRWSKWEQLHEELAAGVRKNQRYRFTNMSYAATP